MNEIAIIGMSGQFPGAKTLAEFWQNLREGRESIRFFTDEELEQAGIARSLFRQPDYVKAAPVLEDIDRFDAAFFNISRREAEILDPQQRLLLQCAWAAIEDAGYALDNYRGAIGVYAGSGGAISSYLLEYLAHYPDARGDTGSIHHLGNDKDFLATRVSYKLNLQGPSLAVQTACSTSLVAVHLACQSLLNGECDMALAGGVSVRIPHIAGHLMTEGSIFSADGHMRAFAADAQGVVFGSGVGLVLLKPLAQALKDKDAIEAVIKGTAINNDGGGKMSYMATAARGQAGCFADALAVADIRAETLDYIEAHGTGTAMGDPVEINALTRVIRSDTQKNQYCAIGSVKNNVGHLDTAAGITSLMKVVLCLKHRRIPPCIHFNSPNPKIDFSNSPFYINTAEQTWERTDSPRRAGVNCLGIGGTNAFAILEEAPPESSTQPLSAGQNKIPSHYLVVLSAKTVTALQHRLRDLLHWLEESGKEESGQAVSLQSVAFTLHLGRNHFAKRCAFVVADCRELQKSLADKLSEPGWDSTTILTQGGEEPLAEEANATLQTLGEQTLEMLTNERDISREIYQEKLALLANLYVQGYELNWDQLYPGENGMYQRAHLPTYPFQRERYWIESPKADSEEQMVSNINDEVSHMGREQTLSAHFDWIAQQVREAIAKELKIPLPQLDSDASLIELGGDSITLLKVAQDIKRTYGVQLSIRQLFEELSTVNTLATYIHQSLPEEWFTTRNGHQENTQPPVFEASPQPLPAAVTREPSVPLLLEPGPASAIAGHGEANTGGASNGENSILERMMTRQIQAMSRLMSQQLDVLSGHQ